MTTSNRPSNARALSLRDPAGTLFEIESKLVRQLHSQGLKDWAAIKESSAFKKLVSQGFLVKTWELSDAEIKDLFPDFDQTFTPETPSTFLGHDKIKFISYPYEWAPEMLKAAGLLTLDFAIELSVENLGLKDATPFNVLFNGCNPVFVDLLSIEKRNPKDSLWLAYSQFSRTFINPLLAYKHFGHTLKNVFLLRREGLTASHLFSQSSFLKKLHPSLISQMTVPALLESWTDRKLSNHPNTHRLMEEKRAKFTFDYFLKSARRSFSNITFDHKKLRTQFKNYMGSESPYSRDQFSTKEKMVRQWVETYSEKSVLDIGCNDGHFSRIAADVGRWVCAIDSESELISKTWNLCRDTHPSILPLVVNIADPSPASGWKNREYKSFLERSRGQFDCVLMLALVHHLLTTESILLPYIIELASELTTDHVILEWVGINDPMFQHLSKGRDYSHLTIENFESEAKKRFQIVQKCELPGKTRTLYCLKKL